MTFQQHVALFTLYAKY